MPYKLLWLNVVGAFTAIQAKKAKNFVSSVFQQAQRVAEDRGASARRRYRAVFRLSIIIVRKPERYSAKREGNKLLGMNRMHNCLGWED